MPSSRPVGATIAAAGLGAVGLVVLAAALVGDAGGMLALTGLAVVATGVAIWLGTTPPRAKEGSAALAAAPADPVVRVPLRPHVPVANLLVFGALTALGLGGMLAIGLGDGGLLLLPVVLLCALPLPDTVRALLRRPTLTLTQEAVDLRGWGVDAALGWDDVAAVGVAVPHPRRPVLRVSGEPGAPSYRSRTQRWVVPLDARPEGEQVDIRLQALDNPGALEVALVEMAARDAAGRRAFLVGEAVLLLTADVHSPR